MKGRRVGLALWLALVLLQPAWYLWLAPPASASPCLALAFTLPPLLLPLLALRRGVGRALIWTGMLALFYFAHGIVAAWVAPTTRLPALAESLLAAALVLSLGLAARRARRGKGAARA